MSLEQRVGALLAVQAARIHQPRRAEGSRPDCTNRIDRRGALPQQRRIRPEGEKLLADGRPVHEQAIEPAERGAELAKRRQARPLVGVVLAAHERRGSRCSPCSRPPCSELVRVHEPGAGEAGSEPCGESLVALVLKAVRRAENL